MEYTWLLSSSTLLIISFVTTIFLFFKQQSQKRTRNLPPGPPKLPLIGNLHQLASKTTLPHHRLAELPKRYGPIMHLQLGEIPIVVIPSPEMAKEVMRTHDLVLCSRPKMMMPEVVFYNCSDIALTPYGEYWRQVRKIATLELFATHRVQAFRPVKEEEVMDAIKSLVTQAKAGSVVNLSDIIFALNFNIILRITMNKKGKDGKEFRQLIADVAEIISEFSISDLYPSLMFISTITGMKGKLQGIVKRFDKLMDPIIKDHISTNRYGKDQKEDLVDILLKFHKDELHLGTEFSLTTDSIKAIVFELFGAASETSSTTIEWVFSELLKNPKAMEKAQKEVRQVLQGKEMMINQESLEKLVYLKFVIKETLRLHPPFPCLVPRESMDRCVIKGYEIPPKTGIFINAWAIGRDSKYWKDSNKFNPERFEDSSIDYKGTYFELIPFGAGRRICPGMGLGIAIVELVLAMLLYHFNWELPYGSSPEDLDMDETFGIVVRKKVELQVIPVHYSLSGFK
ncbi:cytochrome P450 71D8-like [Chenopodium quinoa]|uniref:cytochrome P450 71D8-like n=1 Tax=Chenopodium quinoa TaxID=63459 RepID=UPI000B76CBBB|nr:cytochrome P450 71D8-like [Chenopodium quinoa]